MIHTARKLTSKIRGFTLIELLIVIAVIGILATAVLSAIDPVEQIKKGRDTTRRSDSAEFLNAAERYYTTFEEYPWDAASCTGTACATPTQTALDTMLGSTNPMGELLDKNELKNQYTTRPYLDELFATEDSDNLVHICFLPESRTFQAEAATGGLQRDGTSTGCSGITGATGCHACVPE